jgi:hypothetical protein
VKKTTYNRAARSTAATFGILVGVAAIEHGFFEVLRGDVKPDSLFTEAIGPAQRFWEYGTEHALTVIPSFLFSGIAAMIVGVVIILWASIYIERRSGALVLFLLGVVSFLVGGGFAPIFLTILAGATAAAIPRTLRLWRRIFPIALRLFLSRLWPGTLIAVVVFFVISVEIAVFGYPLLWLFDAETTMGILNALAYAMVGLMLLSVLTALAFDTQEHVKDKV